MTIHERALELIEWINGARYKSSKNGLENMRILLEKLDHPEKAFPCCHIAGTNGKGSVCAFTESALRCAGLRTGLYTSPYIISYNERIAVNGEPVSDETLVRCGDIVRREAEKLTEEGIFSTAFELGTALAFMVFKDAKVDFAVIETGLGGRLDSTNVLSPIACAITAIGMDHMSILGDTIEQIASEKAGIIKPETPVALFPQVPQAMGVLFSACKAQNAPYHLSEALPIYRERSLPKYSVFEVGSRIFGDMSCIIALPGKHQIQNARLAITLLEILREKGLPIEKDHVLQGLSATRWPGRLEWFGNNLLLDGAHNPHGASALRAFCEEFLPDRHITILTGMMRDKQPEEYVKIMAPIAERVIATHVDWSRAMEPEELAALYKEQGVETSFEDDPKRALYKALAPILEKDAEQGLVLVCGSLYLVGDIRKALLDAE